MRPQHKRSTRTKAVVAAAVAAAATTAAIVLPQANATPAAQAQNPTAIPGTAWAVDPRTNTMVVTADSTVTGDNWDRLTSTVPSMDRNAVVQRAPGEFSLFAEGGDAIFGGGGRCSLGFNVTTRDGNPGLLTAGHCTRAARRWSLSSGGRTVATVQQATFPGNDFALLSYDNANTRAPSVIDTGNGRTVQIQRAQDAAIDQQVFRMGSTTGLRSGRVTGLGATVNFREGTVTGLIQTTVCAEQGDSGGPLFTRAGGAIGLTSGGAGNCRTGGVTFFQPVTAALNAVGARIP